MTVSECQQNTSRFAPLRSMIQSPRHGGTMETSILERATFLSTRRQQEISPRLKQKSGGTTLMELIFPRYVPQSKPPQLTKALASAKYAGLLKNRHQRRYHCSSGLLSTATPQLVFSRRLSRLAVKPTPMLLKTSRNRNSASGLLLAFLNCLSVKPTVMLLLNFSQRSAVKITRLLLLKASSGDSANGCGRLLSTNMVLRQRYCCCLSFSHAVLSLSKARRGCYSGPPILQLCNFCYGLCFSQEQYPLLPVLIVL
jgi:hypothetical protein